MQVVGFWWRVLAALIDGVIITIIYLPIMIIAGGAMFAGSMSGMDGMGEADAMAMGAGIGLGMNLISLLVYVGYEALFTSSKMMATPGKRLLGFAVVTEQGQRLSFGRAIGRAFGKILSQMILLIGFIMVAFTGKKQGLHDLIAKTLVVQRDSMGAAA